MLSIVPTTNHNTNFKAAPAIPDIKALGNALAAISEGEKILPKNATIVSMDKSILSKFKAWFQKMYSVRLDYLYRHEKLSIINRKYDTQERLRVLEYKHGAYKKFVYCSDLVDSPHIFRFSFIDEYFHGENSHKVNIPDSELNKCLVSEERFPSGETKYYDCYIVATNDLKTVDEYDHLRQCLRKHVLSDGTTYTYNYYENGNIQSMVCSDGTSKSYYRNGKCKEEIFPDKSRITYFSNGDLKEKYGPNFELIKSNLIK